MSDPFQSGAAASARVTADPFWSVVRRRHPDLDIALLPPAAEPPSSRADPPLVERDEEAQRWETEADRLWRACVGDLRPTGTDSRWTAGARAGSRYETTWRLDGADPVATITVIDRAARVLGEDGWHVLVPAGGLPRVLAGVDHGAGRVEAQLVLAPQQARLVLRLRSGDVLLRGLEHQA